jgi:hypothetical protein
VDRDTLRLTVLNVSRSNNSTHFCYFYVRKKVSGPAQSL